MKNRPDGHIGVLDGLRALAILLVLSSHSLEMIWHDMSKPYMPLGPFDLAAFLKNGFFGVDLFFVLSGFLIAGQLLDGGIAAPEGRRRLIVFYFMRRAARIIPAYYLILTFATVMFMSHDPLRRGALSWAHSYAVHLLFLHNFFYVDYNPVFWSVAVEMQFYLLAPLFLMAVMRIHRPVLRYSSVFGLIVALALLRTAAVLHFDAVSPNFNNWFFHIRIALPFCLDGILGGVLCNMLWRDEKIRAFLCRPPVRNALFFFGLILFVALAGLRPPLENGVTLFDKTFLTFFVAMGFCCMMLGLLAGSAGQRLFSSRPLRHIALVSYSMYLLHRFAIDDIFMTASALTSLSRNHFVTYFADFLLFLAILMFISTLIYHLVEKPFMERVKKGQA